MPNFLPLMRTGTFKDRHGGIYNITKDVLDKLASTFDAARPPAILVGHPDTASAPSFGIVEALKVVGDKLMFKPGKVVAEFAALVRRGGFPGVSAGLTRDLTRVDHIAMLSAQKPAIDGLEPIAEFSAVDNKEWLTLDVTDVVKDGIAEFADAPDWWYASRLRDVARVLRNIKNYLIERSDVETADAVIPEYVIEALKEDPPVEEESTSESPEFNIAAATLPPIEPPVKDFKAEYDDLLLKYEAERTTTAEFTKMVQRLTDEKTELQKHVVELERAGRLAEFSAFIEERIAAGVILPSEKQKRVDEMETMFMLGGAEFSSDPVKYPKALDIYKRDLMSRGRVAPKAGEMIPAPQFAAAVSPPPLGDGSEVGNKARAYSAAMAARGIKVSAIDAVKHIAAGGGMPS